MTGIHVKIGLLSLLLFLVFMIPMAWILNNAKATPLPQADIAVEHATPAVVEFSRLWAEGGSMLDVAVDGSDSIVLHAPATWLRQEVRGASLAEIVSLPEENGFMRWTIPGGATVRFALPATGKIHIHNPSGTPLTIHSTIVDPAKERRDEDAVIITTDSYTLL